MSEYEVCDLAGGGVEGDEIECIKIVMKGIEIVLSDCPADPGTIGNALLSYTINHVIEHFGRESAIKALRRSADALEGVHVCTQPPVDVLEDLDDEGELRFWPQSKRAKEFFNARYVSAVIPGAYHF